MLRLIKPDVAPVGGYYFVDPDTGFQYNNPYKSFEDLEAHVIQYRDNNKLPKIEELRFVWENWMCHQPSMKGRCCAVVDTIARSFEQYIAGAAAWVRTKFATDRFVSQEVATARAATCADCNQNIKNIGHNMSQFYTDRFMRSQVGPKTTPYDKQLYTCKICTCLLRSKVHYAQKTVVESLTQAEIINLKKTPRKVSDSQPVVCWQLSKEENKA